MIFTVLKGLPLLAGQRRQPHKQRVHDDHHDRQLQTVHQNDADGNTRRQQHLEKVVGKHVQEIRRFGNRPVEAIDNRPGQLAIKITLRQAKQVMIVPRRQLLFEPRGHHVAPVTAKVSHNRIRHVKRQ